MVKDVVVAMLWLLPFYRVSFSPASTTAVCASLILKEPQTFNVISVAQVDHRGNVHRGCKVIPRAHFTGAGFCFGVSGFVTAGWIKASRHILFFCVSNDVFLTCFVFYLHFYSAIPKRGGQLIPIAAEAYRVAAMTPAVHEINVRV